MKNKRQKPFNPLEGERPEMSIDTLQVDSAEEQVSIIIVHKDTPEYLNICLQSVSVATLNNNYEIVVVDNASTSTDSLDFLDDLDKQSHCKVIRNKENLWWSKAANIGAKAALKSAKYLIFMHSDVVVLNPAWIDLLVNVSESQDSGLVGVSMQSYVMDKQKVDFIEEWCMLVTRECWQDCGPFIEELPLVGAPFMFTMAAQLADHKPQVIRNQIVYHYGVFGIDYNDFEVLSESALAMIPGQLRNIQNKVKKRQR